MRGLPPHRFGYLGIQIARAACPLFSFRARAHLFVMLYLLPAWIGDKKRNANAILALNLLLGWTFIGWVIALVWALTKDHESQ